MAQANSLQTTSNHSKPSIIDFTREQVETMKNTVAKGTSDQELNLFLTTCRRTGLDPFSRQIYCSVKEYTNKHGEKIRQFQIQTTIDGFRVIAERSGKYQGQEGPFWCGTDGVWKDVWLDSKPPVACKIGILRSDFSKPLWAVGKTSSYRQDRSPVWDRMPELMISKCAESLALRKAFPNDLSGLYTNDEMAQIENDVTPVIETPRATFIEPPVKTDKVVSFLDAPETTSNEEENFLNSLDEQTDSNSNHPSDYVFSFGKYKGKSMRELGLSFCKEYVEWMESQATKNKQELYGAPLEIQRHLKDWLVLESEEYKDFMLASEQ